MSTVRERYSQRMRCAPSATSAAVAARTVIFPSQEDRSRNHSSNAPLVVDRAQKSLSRSIREKTQTGPVKTQMKSLHIENELTTSNEN